MARIKVLVIDDREENRVAADEFFTSQNIAVEFATNFEEGKGKLDNHIERYHGAIIDLELPIAGVLMEIGFSLARLAENYGLPCIVLTAGIDSHHHGGGTISKIYDEDAIELDRGPTKEDPYAWERAWRQLLKLWPIDSMQEIFVSRKRYKENTGQQYKKRPEPKKGISPNKK